MTLDNNTTISDIHNILRTLKKYSDSDIVQQILKDAFDPITEDQKDQNPTLRSSPRTTKENFNIV